MDKKNLSLALASIAIVLALIAMIFPTSVKNLGGLIEQRAVVFVNGFKIGQAETTFIDSSRNITAGTISGSTGTFTGAITATNGTFSGTLGVTGASTQGIINASGLITASGGVTSTTLIATGLKTLSSATTTISSPLTITGATTNSGTFTQSGVFTLSGNSTISGNPTITGQILINESASSTLVIGQTTDITDTGCLKMWDQNASTTPFYVYIDSSIGTDPTYGLVATSTQPIFCR